MSDQKDAINPDFPSITGQMKTGPVSDKGIVADLGDGAGLIQVDWGDGTVPMPRSHFQTQGVMITGAVSHLTGLAERLASEIGHKFPSDSVVVINTSDIPTSVTTTLRDGVRKNLAGEKITSK